MMYDRRTESRRPQLTGLASVGVRTGTEVVAVPVGTVASGDFVLTHPGSVVLSQDTGCHRPCGTNPCAGLGDADEVGSQ